MSKKTEASGPGPQYEPTFLVLNKGGTGVGGTINQEKVGVDPDLLTGFITAIKSFTTQVMPNGEFVGVEFIPDRGQENIIGGKQNTITIVGQGDSTILLFERNLVKVDAIKSILTEQVQSGVNDLGGRVLKPTEGVVGTINREISKKLGFFGAARGEGSEEKIEITENISTDQMDLLNGLYGALGALGKEVSKTGNGMKMYMKDKNTGKTIGYKLTNLQANIQSYQELRTEALEKLLGINMIVEAQDTGQFEGGDRTGPVKGLMEEFTKKYLKGEPVGSLQKEKDGSLVYTSKLGTIKLGNTSRFYDSQGKEIMGYGENGPIVPQAKASKKS